MTRDEEKREAIYSCLCAIFSDEYRCVARKKLSKQILSFNRGNFIDVDSYEGDFLENVSHSVFAVDITKVPWDYAVISKNENIQKGHRIICISKPFQLDGKYAYRLGSQAEKLLDESFVLKLYIDTPQNSFGLFIRGQVREILEYSVWYCILDKPESKGYIPNSVEYDTYQITENLEVVRSGQLTKACR